MLAHVKCLTCAAKIEAARQCAESIDLWDLADFLFRHFKIDRKTLGSVPFLHQATIEGAGCLLDAVAYNPR